MFYWRLVMKRFRKALALLIAFAMILGITPITASAAYINTLWDFESATAGAAPSGATIATTNADRGTMTATVSATGGYAGSKSLNYAISAASTNSNKQTQTLRLSGGSITNHSFSENDIMWFYLKSDTNTNYRMLFQFRVGNSSVNFTATNIYTLDGNGNVTAISRVTSATIANDGLGIEYHASNGSSSGIVVGKSFEGWIGIPVVSTDSQLINSTVSAIDIFVRKSGQYADAVSAGSNLYFDNFTVSSMGLGPVSVIKEVSSIEWVSQPSKTSYELGEALDVTGGYIRVNYTDTTSEVIPMTTGMVSGFSAYTAGSQTLTVEYEGFSLSYNAEVTMQSTGRRYLFWDVDTVGNPFIFPGSDRDSGANNTDLRGRMTFSIDEDAGIDGSAALAMTVETASTNAGILNGTLQRENWVTSGVTGVKSKDVVAEDDVFWFWVDNKLGQNEFVVVEFTTGTTNAGGTPTATDRTNSLFTIVNGQAVELTPGKTVGSFTNNKSNARGAILVANGGSGWVGIPLYDIEGLQGGDKAITGLRLYVRSQSGDNNGTVGRSIYFDEFWVCSQGLLPDRSAVAVVSMELTSDPDKTEYETGEAINLAGAELTVAYQNGDTEIIPVGQEMISGYNTDTAGVQTITVSYEGFTDTFDVNVTYVDPSYAQCLWDIDNLPSDAVLPGTDSTANRGSTVLEISDTGLRGSKALMMTVNVKSSNGGIINGVSNKWSKVTGFTPSREIRKGDIFWIWAENGFSTEQYISIEFNNYNFKTPASTERTLPLYTITASGGNAVMTTIPAGSTVNGITNDRAARGVIRMAAGASGWVGFTLDDIIWGTAITGIRIYARSITGDANGEFGESMNFDEPWVVNNGMPALGTKVLLNTALPNIVDKVYEQLTVGSTIKADFYFKLNRTLASDESIVFNAKLGSYDARELTGTRITSGDFNGYYKFTFNEIFLNQLTDEITGEVILRKSGSDDEAVYRVKSDRGISVENYCGILVRTYPSNTKLKNFLANMLKFGAALQEYSEYKTDRLAGDSVWANESQKNYSVDTPPTLVVQDAVGTVNTVRSASVWVGNKVSLKFKVRADGASDTTIIINSGSAQQTYHLTDSVVTDLGEGLYLVEIADILPQQFDTYFTVSVAKAGVVKHAVRYGVYTYLARMNASEGLSGLLSALNNYGHAADEYISANGGSGEMNTSSDSEVLLEAANVASVWETSSSNLSGQELTASGLVTKDLASGQNDVNVRMLPHKGFGDSLGMGITLTSAEKTTTAKVVLSADNLFTKGFKSFKPASDDDMFWFYADATDMTSDNRLDIKLNSATLRIGASVYTIEDNSGSAAITQIGYNSAANSVTSGIATVANAGTASYSRIKITAGFCGWIGVKLSDFTKGGTITSDTVVNEISLQLYQHNSQDAGKKQVGNTVYFSAFRTASSGTLPKIGSSENLLYTRNTTYTTSQILSDKNLFVPGWYTGTNVSSLWTAANNNWSSVKAKAKAYDNYDSNILAVAHRADRWESFYPENSLQSVISVVLYGADMVEVDTKTTKDGVMILMHDETLTKTTNVTAYREAHPGTVPDSDNVSAWTYAQIQLLNLKYSDNHCGLKGRVSPYQVPKLEDAVRAIAGRAYLTIDGAPSLSQLNSFASSISKAGESVLVPYWIDVYGTTSYNSYLQNLGVHLVEVNTLVVGRLDDRLAAMEDMNVNPVIRPSKATTNEEIPQSLYDEVETYAGTYHIYGEKLGGGLNTGLETTNGAYRTYKSMIQKGYSVLMCENTYRLVDFVKAWNAGTDLSLHDAETVLDFEDAWLGASLPSGSSPSADSNGYGYINYSNNKAIETVSFVKAGDENLSSDASGTVMKWQINETWVGSGDGSVAGLKKCSGATAYLNIDQQSAPLTDLSGFECYAAYVDASKADNSTEIELRLIEKSGNSYVSWDAHGSAGGTGAITVSEYYVQDSTGKWIPGGMFQGRIIVPGGYTGYILVEFDQMASSSANTMQRTEVEYLGIAIRGTEGDTVYIDDLGVVKSKVSEDSRDYFRLTSLFGDHMIFQQNEDILIKGFGAAGQSVSVSLKDDAAGTVIRSESATVASDGTWSVSLDPITGSYKTYTLTATCSGEKKTVKDIVVGEVWITGGQSNMQLRVQESDGWSALYASNWENSNIRLFRQQTAGTTVLGDAASYEPFGTWNTGADWTGVYECSSIGYYWAAQMQKKLGVPVGIVNSAVGGTSISVWVDRAVVNESQYSVFKGILDRLGYYTNEGTLVYVSNYFNTRIAPFAGYEAKGILWYQGEHDRSTPDIQKEGILPLVDSWSRVFNSDGRQKLMSFVAMQVAPYATAASDASMTFHYSLNKEIRDGIASLETAGGQGAAVPTYDFSVIVDNIHPTNKQEVAERAAITAYGLVYNNNLVYQGPSVNNISYNSSTRKVTLTFDNVDSGLNYRFTGSRSFQNPEDTSLLPSDHHTDKLNGFSVWDGLQIYDAAAVISGTDKVVVTVPAACENVIGVFYGYGTEILTANLYNLSAGYAYPALPFLAEIPGATIASHSVRLWDGGDTAGVTAGTAVGTVTAADGRTTTTSTVAAGKGFPTAGGSATKAWAYTLTNVVKTGSDVQATTATLNVGSNSVGFNTNVTPASGDIFWFWVNAELTGTQSLFVYLNSNQMKTSRIYTIVNAGGSAAIRTLGINNSYNGITLANHGSSGWQKIVLNSNARGWIGIPVDAVANSVGTLVNTVQIFTRSYTPTAQANGDAVYFDEFWVASSGMMPNLSDSRLINGLPSTTLKRSTLWDINSLTAGAEGAVSGQTLPAHDTSNTNRGHMDFSIAAEGINGSNAFVMTVSESSNANGGGIVNGTQLRENWITSGVSGFTSSGTVQTGDIFWVWAYNGSSETKYAVVEFTSGTTNLGGTYVTKNNVVRTQNLYTIAEGSSGAYVRTVAPDETFEGLTNSTSTVGAIKLDAGWSGWIGIPLDDLTGQTAVGKTIDGFRLYTRALNTSAATGTIGDKLVLDGFCLTEEGVLPSTTQSELLYKKS